MTKSEYESLQVQLSALIKPYELYIRGYKHNRDIEIYCSAILKVRQMLKNYYESSGDKEAKDVSQMAEWGVQDDIRVLRRDGYNAAADRLEKLAARDEAKPLDSDGCGDAYCPNCGTWMSEYHPKYFNRLDEPPQNYCDNCGQHLIWEVS